MINRPSMKGFGLTLMVLAGILGILFSRSFTPELILFSSDGPLGAISAKAFNMSTAWSGAWQDLNWLGIEYPAALPHTTSLFWFVLGNNAVNSLKFQTPLALMGLGLSLWVLLRQFGFRHSVCALGAIAGALNMNSFSHATWGLPSRAWTLASTFLAIAALQSGVKNRPLLKALLAGLAVANGIMEGFDVGAIYSLYVAAFAAFVVLAQPGGFSVGKAGKAVLRVGVVAVFAGVCAAAALSTLIGTQIQGVTGMGQDAEAKSKRWNEATQWSLPKVETLRVLVPGLFGYRMDADGGANYWGAVGQTPGYPTTRHSGAGEYAGALVVVIAAFGIANGFRKKGNPYSQTERRTVQFFAALALISVLFAWGRHAPFYRIIYSLPYFSTIRNPIKFMHPFHMALLILFGFGLEALFRLYIKEPAHKIAGLQESVRAWWKAVQPFERKWAMGSVGAVIAALVATLVYTSSQRQLVAFLGQGGFPAPLSQQMASFSFGEAGVAVLFVALSVALLIVALSGWFSGSRAKLFVLLAGAFLALDLMRANGHWIVYYNYKDRYATNPVIDFLRRDSYEHRVTARIFPFSQQAKAHLVDPQSEDFVGVLNTWLQHQFQFYNIQSLEPVQMPRMPELDEAFVHALTPNGSNRTAAVLSRMWQLSNTRYFLGSRQAVSTLGQSLGLPPFKIALAFDMAPKPGLNKEQLTLEDVDWVANENGRFAIAEYPGVLPRAKLYPMWRQSTNDLEVLDQLGSPTFDPQSMVFIREPVSLQPSAPTNFSGNVMITQYAPKRIEMSASNSAPSILLYNDKYSPNWKVTVDGKPETLLRANYIMRGIPLAAGNHTVVLQYSQPTTGLKVSLGGIVLGLGILLFLGLGPGKSAPRQT